MTTKTEYARFDRPVAWTLLVTGAILGLLAAPAFAPKAKAEPAPVAQAHKPKPHHRKSTPAPKAERCAHSDADQVVRVEVEVITPPPVETPPPEGDPPY